MINLNKLQQLIIPIVGIIILWLGVTYLKDKIIVMLGGYTTQTTTTIIDSTFVKGKIDTIAVFNHYVETKGIILNPKPEIIYINTPVYIGNGESMVKDSLKSFTVEVKDSLIEGKVKILNAFNGDLKQFDFKYKPLFPKYIKSIDTVYINKTITKTLTNERSLLGLGAGYNNLQYFSILGSYTTKKKLQIIYEYGKPLSDTKELVNGVPFEFQPNDLHSIKIIKHF